MHQVQQSFILTTTKLIAKKNLRDVKHLQKTLGCLNLPLGGWKYLVLEGSVVVILSQMFHLKMEKCVADYPMKREIPSYPALMKFYF